MVNRQPVAVQAFSSLVPGPVDPSPSASCVVRPSHPAVVEVHLAHGDTTFKRAMLLRHKEVQEVVAGRFV